MVGKLVPIYLEINVHFAHNGSYIEFALVEIALVAYKLKIWTKNMGKIFRKICWR